jgi:hypothetical protein
MRSYLQVIFSIELLFVFCTYSNPLVEFFQYGWNWWDLLVVATCITAVVYQQVFRVLL